MHARSTNIEKEMKKTNFGVPKRQSVLFLHFFSPKFDYMKYLLYLCIVFPIDVLYGCGV